MAPTPQIQPPSMPSQGGLMPPPSVRSRDRECHDAMYGTLAQQGGDVREQAFGSATSSSRSLNSSVAATQPSRDLVQPQTPSQQPDQAENTSMQTVRLSSGKEIRYTPAEGRRALAWLQHNAPTTLVSTKKPDAASSQHETNHDSSSAPPSDMLPPAPPARPATIDTTQPAPSYSPSPSDDHAAGLCTYQEQPVQPGSSSSDLPNGTSSIRTLKRRPKEPERYQSEAEAQAAQHRFRSTTASHATAEQIANNRAAAEVVSHDLVAADEDVSRTARLNEELHGAQNYQDNDTSLSGLLSAEIKKRELALQKQEADVEARRLQQGDAPRTRVPASEEGFREIRVREIAAKQQQVQMETQRQQISSIQRAQRNTLPQGPPIPVTQGDVLPPPSAAPLGPPFQGDPSMTAPQIVPAQLRPDLQAPNGSRGILTPQPVPSGRFQSTQMQPQHGLRPNPAPNVPAPQANLANHNGNFIPNAFTPTNPYMGRSQLPPMPTFPPLQTAREIELQQLRTTIGHILTAQDILQRYSGRTELPQGAGQTIAAALWVLSWFWHNLGGRG